MIAKRQKVDAMIEHCHGQGMDPHYFGYFDYFNRGLFYEAHDVLEQLWLADRNSPDYAFYKGLIQLAGAFVHLQKGRLRPAAALFKLAHANFANYPEKYQRLDIEQLQALIARWLALLEEGGFALNPLSPGQHPKITLLS